MKNRMIQPMEDKKMGSIVIGVAGGSGSGKSTFTSRISRDVEERGRDLNGIIKQYLTTVKPMHYLYVEPTRSKADIVINSGKNDIAFDLFVSKIKLLLDKK